VIGIILGAAYLLWLYQRVMFGPVTNPANEHLADLNAREYATLVPLIILCFWIGIYPKPLFRVLERPVQQIVEQVNPGYYGAERASAPAVNGVLTPVPIPGATGMPGMNMPSNTETAPAPETGK
jgi:NADH-quinone oxidoreductase subunit M